MPLLAPPLCTVAKMLSPPSASAPATKYVGRGTFFSPDLYGASAATEAVSASAELVVELGGAKKLPTQNKAAKGPAALLFTFATFLNTLHRKRVSASCWGTARLRKVYSRVQVRLHVAAHQDLDFRGGRGSRGSSHLNRLRGNKRVVSCSVRNGPQPPKSVTLSNGRIV